jgi:hypothetical protein
MMHLADVIAADRFITIDDFWLTFVIATVLPAVTALVVKRFASSSAGAMVLLFLSVVTGALTSIQASGGSFELKTAAVGVFVAYVTAVASHFGLLKPAGVTGSDGAIQRAIPGGVGSDGL